MERSTSNTEQGRKLIEVVTDMSTMDPDVPDVNMGDDMVPDVPDVLMGVDMVSSTSAEYMTVLASTMVPDMSAESMTVMASTMVHGVSAESMTVMASTMVPATSAMDRAQRTHMTAVASTMVPGVSATDNWKDATAIAVVANMMVPGTAATDSAQRTQMDAVASTMVPGEPATRKLTMAGRRIGQKLVTVAIVSGILVAMGFVTWLFTDKDDVLFKKYVPEKSKQYDLFVIGGGSAGLKVIWEAKRINPKLKIAVAEKKKWGSRNTPGYGGTCLHVGCIPKKLAHISAIYQEKQNAMKTLGWKDLRFGDYVWSEYSKTILEYTKTVADKNKQSLLDAGVDIFEDAATFVDANTVRVGSEEKTFNIAVIACGGRPKKLPGDVESHAITSDDLFQKEDDPGDTLIIGAGYIALETAGFLKAFGKQVTVMVRSEILKNPKFNDDIKTLIRSDMENKGVTFIRGTDPKLSKTTGGRIEVEYISDRQARKITVDTVMVAVGREGNADKLDLENLLIDHVRGKVEVDLKSGQTKLKNIYAIGDVAVGSPELQTVAKESGQILARRIFKSGDQDLDFYTAPNDPTVLFTPTEYGSIGVASSFNEQQYTEYENSDNAATLDMKVMRRPQKGFIKVFADPKANGKIVGVHIFGPNAGEVLQGLAVAVNHGATINTLQKTLAIHPTFAEGLVKVQGGGAAPDPGAGC